jgi:hypothetical protein
MPSDDGTDLVEDFLGGPDPDPDPDPDVSEQAFVGGRACGCWRGCSWLQGPGTSSLLRAAQPAQGLTREACRVALLLRTRPGRRTVGSKPRWSGTGPSRPSA